MNKVIHYCWFGPKPLPRLAKKCIKSWQKYLPDYEIKICNESNFDINSCNFVKEAYEAGKWAFVSDYARLYSLYNEGGIYFDTDMEILKNIDFLKDKDFFIGREYSGYIAAGVIGVLEPKNKYIKEMLQYYESIEHFNMENLFDYAIPKVITKVLEKYECRKENNIEIYNNDCFVYPVDYFYPISYDRSSTFYSENTCMIHYYDATWVPNREKITLKMYRTFGKKKTKRLFSMYRNIKYKVGKVKGISKKSCYYLKRYVGINVNVAKRIEKVKNSLNSLHNKDVIVISNPDNINTYSLTKRLFNEIIKLRNVYKEREAVAIGKMVASLKPDMIIFSGFNLRWWQIIQEIKNINKEIKVKVIWYESISMLTNKDIFLRFSELTYIYEEKMIDEIGFFKKDMKEFFKTRGYKTRLLYSSLNIDKSKLDIPKEIKKDNKVKIGIYLGEDKWENNIYTQISAASLIENVKIDIIFLTNKIKDFSRILKFNITGEEIGENEEKMYLKMKSNDVNLYITFADNSSLDILDSLELGVPALTSDSNNLFLGTELEKYLVIDKAGDIIYIRDKIKSCLENKDKIIELYNIWRADYISEVEKKKEEFLKID